MAAAPPKAVLGTLKRAVPDLDHTYHVVDLCCGKMLTGALLREQYPSVAVTGIDILEGGDLPTCAFPDRYKQLDVLGVHFVALLDQLLRAEDKARGVAHKVVLLGVHLCGALL